MTSLIVLAKTKVRRIINQEIIMKRKTLTQLVCVLTGTAMLAGCAPAASQQGTSAASVSASSAGSETVISTSGMKPWINSTIKGVVTDAVTADLKDDFYLAVNHDWLRDAQFRPGYTSEAPFFEAMDIVKNRCFGFLENQELTGADADVIRNYYELWLDWDSRTQAPWGAGTLESLIRRSVTCLSLRI